MKVYHVHHILVKAKYEAEDLLRMLNSGKDFSEVAKKNSICASAKMGGDLGVLKIGQADEDFEIAALQLKIGAMSDTPLRTKFGYHLLKKIS